MATDHAPRPPPPPGGQVWPLCGPQPWPHTRHGPSLSWRWVQEGPQPPTFPAPPSAEGPTVTSSVSVYHHMSPRAARPPGGREGGEEAPIKRVQTSLGLAATPYSRPLTLNGLLLLSSMKTKPVSPGRRQPAEPAPLARDTRQPTPMRPAGTAEAGSTEGFTAEEEAEEDDGAAAAAGGGRTEAGTAEGAGASCSSHELYHAVSPRGPLTCAPRPPIK